MSSLIPNLTIFTPTYNRCHTLKRLYDSLVAQTSHDFEWLVIDDGSTDNTEKFFGGIDNPNNKFEIRYHKVTNGGKLRAINKALELAKGKYFLILDSDDMLTPDAVKFYLGAFNKITDKSIVGVSGRRGDLTGAPLTASINTDFGEFVDCNNLCRSNYGLERDMAECFRTDILKKYPFPVWEGEKFTPEAVIWDRMALDGYKLRWYNRVTYLCEYQPDGLTNSSWELLKENPMGYAMLFNTRLEYTTALKSRCNLVCQYISCCIMAKEYSYMRKCNAPALVWLMLPLGIILSIRRRNQLKNV